MIEAIIYAVLAIVQMGVAEWQRTAEGNPICGGRPMAVGESWDKWQECTKNLQNEEIRRAERQTQANKEIEKEQKQIKNIAIVGSVGVVVLLIIFKKWRAT